MASKKGVVPEFRTLSPVDTHDYWKELCNKEELRRTNFNRKFKRGVSYSKLPLSVIDIYNGYGSSGEKREATLHSPKKGKYIDFSRIGRLFVVPYHKTALHGREEESLDKTFLHEKDRRSILRRTMQRGLYKRLYDTFDVGTYRKSPEKRMATTDYQWAQSPRKSEMKEKKLKEQIKHERYMS